MTLNAEIAMSIEHKIHRVHYQTHHHHYHVHHLLTSRHHHQHHHHSHIPAIIEDPEKPQDLKRITYDHQNHNQGNHHNFIPLNHHSQHPHQHHHHQPQQQYKKLENSEGPPTTTTIAISPISTTDLSLINAQQPSKKITGCLTATQIQRNQQLSIRNLQRRQAAAKLRQKSQIQFFIFAAFAYILSPIDLIPEIVFGVFGILDDLLFLFMCMFCIAIIIIYPIFREMRRTIFDKLGLKREPRLLVANKSF